MHSSVRADMQGFQCRTQHCVCRDVEYSEHRVSAPGVSMPHAALCVSRPGASISLLSLRRVSMPHAALCVSRPSLSGTKCRSAVFQCRTQHCVCRDMYESTELELWIAFQCRTQHCVCRDMKQNTINMTPHDVSMPHAALCVSRRSTQRFRRALGAFQCRTQHCVCRDTL